MPASIVWHILQAANCSSKQLPNKKCDTYGILGAIIAVPFEPRDLVLEIPSASIWTPHQRIDFRIETL
jgi:hypothetical protein